MALHGFVLFTNTVTLNHPNVQGSRPILCPYKAQQVLFIYVELFYLGCYPTPYTILGTPYTSLTLPLSTAPVHVV